MEHTLSKVVWRHPMESIWDSLIRQHQVLLMKRKLTGIVSTVTGKQIILILNGQLQRRVLVARRTGSTATMVVERT